MNTKNEVVQWLRDVSSGEVGLGKRGLCYYLENILASYTDGRAIMHFLYSIMSMYALENGTTSTFPVPHPTMDPYDAYYDHKRSHASMNDESEYGMNRRRLAKWLADQLEKSDVD